MLTWMSRTALELIGESGLGYSFDSMASEVAEHEYSKTIKNLVFVSFHNYMCSVEFDILQSCYGTSAGSPILHSTLGTQNRDTYVS